MRRGRSARGCEVLDDGERIVKVVQKTLPILVFSGSAKSVGVVLDAIPIHQKQVLTRGLDQT